MPGFSLVVASKSVLLACEGRSRSLVLDVPAQWRGLESNGQFRFTPPTHAMRAFGQALRELWAEGGVAARSRRYRENHRELLGGMRALGFQTLLAEKETSGWIITSFHYPTHPNFTFPDFVQALANRGQYIYPGKVSGKS